ncbi:MAG: hypothetical protein PHI12_03900 [Dehalococcoidales bacterium]|nr:hypothetical protein [Dehalococcoidales bacterium]
MSTDSLTVTMPEAAGALGMSGNLAHQLANRDELPVRVIRLGGKRMVVSR